MNTKTIILFVISTINALSIIKDNSFTQDGCSTNYTDPLQNDQINLSYKCFTPSLTGNCRASIDSYHYNPKTQRCEKSIFGGCDDGCQAFRTQQQCEDECVKYGSEKTNKKQLFGQSQCKVDKPKDKFNNLPIKCFIKTVTGKCRMAIKSYHFDATSGQCVQATFGGCNDGCQVFESMQECQSACNKGY